MCFMLRVPEGVLGIREANVETMLGQLEARLGLGLSRPHYHITGRRLGVEARSIITELRMAVHES
jgi:hypothetical protein